MVITSSIDGRVRFRDPRLCMRDIAQAVQDAVAALPGVVSVAINERVGSLLVMYSKAKAGLESIIDRVSDLLGPLAQEVAASAKRLATATAGVVKNIRRPLLNLGMLFSLMASLIGAIIDAEILHVAAGALFLAVVGIHVYERRRNLVRFG